VARIFALPFSPPFSEPMEVMIDPSSSSTRALLKTIDLIFSLARKIDMRADIASQQQ
jgi:hypothetical protein